MRTTRMARYMMMARARDNGRDNRGGERGNDYGVRNNYDVRNEGGNYVRDNYDVDNRFRDRRGREHYDNGRFAPRGNYPMENRGDDGRGGERYSGGQSIMPWYPGMENRGDREGGSRMRSAYDDDEDKPGMNMIGFDRPQEVSNHYPTRIDYQGGNEMEHRSGMKMAGGAMGTSNGLDKETAEKWVHSMKNADGTEGEHWRIDQVKAIMSQKAIDRNIHEVYAVMNALYSDYGKVLKKRGVTTADVYLEMALAFLDDPDAVPGKAAAYYECIVKH